MSSEFIIGAINVPPALLFKTHCLCWMKHWHGLLVPLIHISVPFTSIPAMLGF